MFLSNASGQVLDLDFKEGLKNLGMGQQHQCARLTTQATTSLERIQPRTVDFVLKWLRITAYAGLYEPMIILGASAV
jgi:hypothetical protein